MREGPLSTENLLDIMDDLFDRIGNRAASNDGIVDWLTRQDVMKSWVMNRVDAIDQTFVSRPKYSVSESAVPLGTRLEIGNDEGLVYVTNDGSDPRAAGGAISESARLLTRAIDIDHDQTIIARKYVNGQWSGTQRADFVVSVDAPLSVSEINFHPRPASVNEEWFGYEEFQFVEITNTGMTSYDLEGVRIVGIDLVNRQWSFEFRFDAEEIHPDDRLVVARNENALRSRYGDNVSIASGSGGNSLQGVMRGVLPQIHGEITLLNSDGRVIQQFEYFAGNGFPDRADGLGSTLEVIDTSSSLNRTDNWKASQKYDGSPGERDIGIEGQVVITEVLASPNNGDDDLIELYNTTDISIHISGLFVSDSIRDIKRRQFDGSIDLSPGQYLVINASRLGIPLDGDLGGDVVLVSENENGAGFSFVDHIQFPASSSGVSVGRRPVTDDNFWPLEYMTFGSANSIRLSRDIVISEVHFAALDLDGPSIVDARDFAFVELYNQSPEPVDLSAWQLHGDFEYTFDQGTVIDTQSTITIVPFNPRTSPRKARPFRESYGMSPADVLVGEHQSDQTPQARVVRLVRPANVSLGPVQITPMITVDQFLFGATDTWPDSADGSGDSLHRVEPHESGRDASNWQSKAPNPGVVLVAPPIPGDSNEDGRFDQLDIIIVLQGAKYSTGVAATFHQGDWNGDGYFDQNDIVFVLQEGTFSPHESISTGITWRKSK